MLGGKKWKFAKGKIKKKTSISLIFHSVAPRAMRIGRIPLNVVSFPQISIPNKVECHLCNAHNLIDCVVQSVAIQRKNFSGKIRASALSLCFLKLLVFYSSPGMPDENIPSLIERT